MDFYQRSALLLDQLEAKRGSLKSLATRHSKNGDSKRLLALCIETLKFRAAITEIVHLSGLSRDLSQALRGLGGSSSSAAPGPSKAAKRPPHPTCSIKSLQTLLVHDLLFSKRGSQLPKEHRVRKEVEKLSGRLRSAKERVKIRRKVQSDQELQTSTLPQAGEEAGDDGVDPTLSNIRWMRVNTIKWSCEDAFAWLAENGWTRSEGDPSSSNGPGSRTYSPDVHLPMLLAFPRDLDLPKFKPYLDGRLIAQDKASCLPPFILLFGCHRPDLSVRALDATAAPGNKTSFLSALLHESQGTIQAFEHDKHRFGTLKTMLAKAGCKNVHPRLADFLSQNPQDPAFAQASHFLVDPSCSGSGITTRLDHLTGNAPDEARVKSLAKFQTTILSHALRFTNAQRVVYSTCSIHEEENENVVLRVLSKPEFKDMWSLAPRSQVLPAWPRRSPYDESMIQCLPEDGLHGFFVACLVRSPAVESQSIVDDDDDGEEWHGID